ncbi:MAG: NADH-quinone oxidoreductase subunit A [Acidobacteria bacterium]|nr:NADH-quinone oxidoreductase subunit A [Acidobacteriota bacterium]
MLSSPVGIFLPVLILLLVGVVLATIILLVSGRTLAGLGLKPHNPQALKMTVYECGAPPIQEGARHRYSVKFYMTAMLFILFDVEAAFLLPWAVQYKNNLGSFWIMLAFFATLLAGYVYVWGIGALEWED